MSKEDRALNAYEQSMMLVALLFERQNLDHILTFFPEDLLERIQGAKQRFLQLSQSDRVTQIIIELRALLNFKEYNTSFVHRSWVDDALDKEPQYLREIIEAQLLQENNINKQVNGSVKKDDFLLKIFWQNIIDVRPKMALFDPALMRIQSINNKNYAKALSDLGQGCLKFLASELNLKRFNKYIERNYNIEPNFNSERMADDLNREVVLLFIKMVVSNKQIQLNIKSGVFLLACYLSFFKKTWSESVKLSLPKNLGLLLIEFIDQIEKLNQSNEAKKTFHDLVIKSLK